MASSRSLDRARRQAAGTPRASRPYCLRCRMTDAVASRSQHVRASASFGYRRFGSVSKPRPGIASSSIARGALLGKPPAAGRATPRPSRARRSPRPRSCTRIGASFAPRSRGCREVTDALRDRVEGTAAARRREERAVPVAHDAALRGEDEIAGGPDRSRPRGDAARDRLPVPDPRARGGGWRRRTRRRGHEDVVGRPLRSPSLSSFVTGCSLPSSSPLG